MGNHHQISAPQDYNERAKALGINVVTDIHSRDGVTPTPEQHEQLLGALHAAHLAILLHLEAVGFCAVTEKAEP